MVCSRCKLPFPREAAHCPSRTCTWCVSCIRKKYEECGIPYKQMGQL
jgi:hypothetical protein